MNSNYLIRMKFTRTNPTLDILSNFGFRKLNEINMQIFEKGSCFGAVDLLNAASQLNYWKDNTGGLNCQPDGMSAVVAELVDAQR